jgi:putative addiction module component (TIGR02574 family)
MPPSLTDIEQQAAQLPAGDRAKLAEFLLESLQEPTIAEVEQAWEEEILRRVAAVDAGEMDTFSAEEVFAEAKNRL